MDIVIPRQISPTLAFEPTELASSNPNSIPQGIVVQITGNSSGFIFAKPFKLGRHMISALVITAAHCVLDVFRNEVESESFSASLEFSWRGDTPVYCTPLLHYLKSKRIASTASTGSNYMLPGYIALLALAGPVDFSMLIGCEIAQDIQKGYECVVPGYPRITSSNSLFLGGKTFKQSTVKRKIRKTFHNFIGRVNSFGEISSASSNLTEIQCSTTAGMSGGPLLPKKNNTYEIAGVYVGGPPLPLQFEALRLAQKVYKTKKYDSNDLVPLSETNGLVYNNDKNLKLNLSILSKCLKAYVKHQSPGQVETVGHFVRSIASRVVSTHPALSRGTDLTYYFNVALPVTHPCVVHAIEIRNKFTTIDQDFSSKYGLVRFLLQ